jgi:hypothetical protein
LCAVIRAHFIDSAFRVTELQTDPISTLTFTHVHTKLRCTGTTLTMAQIWKRIAFFG